MARRTRNKAAAALRPDHGAFVGLAAAGMIVGLWFVTEVTGILAPEHAADGVTAAPVQPEPPASVLFEDGTENAWSAVDPSAPPVWERDPRWQDAVRLGAEGLALAEETRVWHEETGGDPFRYRSQMEAAAKLLERAVTGLEELRAPFASHPSAGVALDAKIQEYAGTLRGARKDS